MRIPLSWLRDYVDVTLPADELAERLTRSGLEVDAVEKLGVADSELPWDPTLVLVCNILEVTQHPNADRLVLAEVEYGPGLVHTVVTGAPNLYQYKGLGRLNHPLKSVFAKEGAVLYDGHVEGKVKVKLKGKPVRGVMSDAMLCSEKELGISEEHEGIMILPDDAPTGTPLVDYLGDVVIDIDVLPNMARTLSMVGMAREIAALTGQTVRLPDPQVTPSGADINSIAKVTIEATALCPRFTATMVKNVTIKPSPFWMQRRLTMAGMRPINNIVDISNYVMLELGTPNHTFDADCVANNHIVVRTAKTGEQLTTLDGRTHQLNDGHLLVCDTAQALSVAGVMGGESSEVSERTRNVLVEAAVWEPTIIRRMSTAFKLRSEASKRFERGVDPEMLDLSQRRLTQLLSDYADGHVVTGMIDVRSQPKREVVIALSTHEVKRILGLTFTRDQVAELLAPLGFVCTPHDVDTLHVAVPSYRGDVSHTADLCEEVARMYGYDNLPSTIMADELPVQRTNLTREREHFTRDILTGAGLNEAITYSLTSREAAAKLDPAELEADHYLRLANPLSPEREFMRRSILPTLLESANVNIRERGVTRLFEIGRVYHPRPDAILPNEPLRAAVVLAGPRVPASWQSSTPESMDFFDVKGAIECLVERLRIADVTYAPSTVPYLQPGRAADVMVRHGKELVTIGHFGELHPDARERFGLPAVRIGVAELDLHTMLELASVPRYQSISRYPATTQDLAMIAPVSVSAEQIEKSIRKYSGNALSNVEIFDVYTGAQVGEGMRSIAYRITLRASDRTLSDDEVSKIRAKIIRGVEFDTGAKIRS
ncbi:MAG: phenylalanine--tRNA ligase subunit beta [Chloroflexi bacterium]|nr:phenylalanine--tRNA ligase subunit beta [Chloroflexota bacterium]